MFIRLKASARPFVLYLVGAHDSGKITLTLRPESSRREFHKVLFFSI